MNGQLRRVPCLPGHAARRQACDAAGL